MYYGCRGPAPYDFLEIPPYSTLGVWELFLCFHKLTTETELIHKSSAIPLNSLIVLIKNMIYMLGNEKNLHPVK